MKGKASQEMGSPLPDSTAAAPQAAMWLTHMFSPSVCCGSVEACCCWVGCCVENLGYDLSFVPGNLAEKGVTALT